MHSISKSQFKAHALEIMRGIEQTGESKTITDHGKPTLEIRKLRIKELPPLTMLAGTLVSYDGPTDSVAESDWDLD